MLPVQVYDYNQSGNGSGSATQFTGAIGFNATRAGGVTEAGRVSQPSTGGYAPMIDRSVVVGDRLFTISASGVMASDLNTFADRGFVAFPGSAGGGSGNTGSGTVQPGGTVTSPPAR